MTLFQSSARQPRPATVALAREERYDLGRIQDHLAGLFTELNLPDQLIGARVLVKPNCTSALGPEHAQTTHPVVAEALLRVLQDLRCKIAVGESPTVGVDSSAAFGATGLEDAVSRSGVPLIDFRQARYAPVPVKDGYRHATLHLPEALLDVDYIISLPKLKTNYVTTISCALKNLKGVLTDVDKREFHRVGLSESVADLACCLLSRARLIAVIDGIEGCELYDARPAGVLIAGTDALACDSVAATIMGLYPEDVKHLRFAWERALGEIQLERIACAGEGLFSAFPRFRSSLPGLSGLAERFDVEILDGRPCSSCLGALYYSLKKAAAADGDLLRGACISAGSDGRAALKPGAFRFGNCAGKGDDETIGIEGCPPRSAEFLSALKRMRSR